MAIILVGYNCPFKIVFMAQIIKKFETYYEVSLAPTKKAISIDWTLVFLDEGTNIEKERTHKRRRSTSSKSSSSKRRLSSSRLETPIKDKVSSISQEYFQKKSNPKSRKKRTLSNTSQKSETNKIITHQHENKQIFYSKPVGRKMIQTFRNRRTITSMG